MKKSLKVSLLVLVIVIIIIISIYLFINKIYEEMFLTDETNNCCSCKGKEQYDVCCDCEPATNFLEKVSYIFYGK